MFEISLAQWSLNRMIRAGDFDSINFATFAKSKFNINAVEYVSILLKDASAAYINELKSRAIGSGVQSLLIMVDREGDIGAPRKQDRAQTIDNHVKWIEAASAMECHSIRVNAKSEGTPQEQHDLAVDGLRGLTERAEPFGINVLVENHGGLSSNGAWLARVISSVDHPNCGTLPDFGNWCFDWNRRDEPGMWYDRYQGVAELMPFAKAISAKSCEFDAKGNEVETDYRRMLPIVLDAGYNAFIGIEYEGEQFSEIEGVYTTRRLLETVRDEISS